MISLLPDYSIATHTNCNIRKTHERCDIKNTKGNGYISFPINSYWNREIIPNDWELTIKGNFTDNTFFYLYFRDEKTDRIYLSDNQNTYTIPLNTITDSKNNGYSNIFFGIGDYENICIEEITFAPKNLYRERKEVYHITEGENINWRTREKGHFIPTNHIRDHTIVYCRPKTELTTSSIRDNIWFKLDKIQEATSAKIINHISTFYDHSLKDRAFLTWNLYGLPTPKYEVVEEHNYTKIKKKWQAQYGNNFIIRLNNTESGNHLHLFNGDKQYNNLLKIQNERLLKGFYGCKIMFVERILPALIKNEPYTFGAKAFVVNGKIICCIVDAFKYIEGYARSTMFITNFEHFVEASNQLQSLTDSWKEKIIQAVEVLGLQSATLDFIIGPNGNPVFLEANSSWGLTNKFRDFPYYNVLIDKLLQNQSILKQDIPDVYTRMDKSIFWKKFYDNL